MLIGTAGIYSLFSESNVTILGQTILSNLFMCTPVLEKRIELIMLNYKLIEHQL